MKRVLLILVYVLDIDGNPKRGGYIYKKGAGFPPTTQVVGFQPDGFMTRTFNTFINMIESKLAEHNNEAIVKLTNEFEAINSQKETSKYGVDSVCYPYLTKFEEEVVKELGKLSEVYEPETLDPFKLSDEQFEAGVKFQLSRTTKYDVWCEILNDHTEIHKNDPWWNKA